MRALFFVLCCYLYLTNAAFAAETPWQQHMDMLRTRMVVGTTDDPNIAVLAWEADLAPGWKTYWRSPGEAGLPVRLSVGGQDLDILYPVPERFELFGLETYGYSNKVLLPVHVARPEGGELDIQGSFMVCKEICVPFDATYHFDAADLAADFSAHGVRIDAWMKKVPDRTQDGGAGLAIEGVTVSGPVGRQRLIVDAHAEAALDEADMLAEIGEAFHFGAPKMKLLADGRTARFVLAAMSGKDPEDIRGKTVRLTFTDGRGHAIERKVEIPK